MGPAGAGCCFRRAARQVRRVRKALFRKADLRRAVQAYAEATGVPADKLSVSIKPDGEILVEARGGDKVATESEWDSVR